MPSPPSRRSGWALLALAVVTAVVVGLVLVWTRGDESPRAATEPPAERPAGPVLLVPGYNSSVPSMQPLADLLVAEGRDATVVTLPDRGTADLRDSAEALDSAVTAALARTGADSVDVVGYSAGGLIARLWVAEGGAEVARRVITLGSPHHGTQLAGVAGAVSPERCPLGCRQMIPGSELLTELNAGDETPDGPDWVSIWTTQDEVVTPPDTSALDGALNLAVQSVCADARVNHSGLLRDPLVQAMVVAQLAPGGPVRLDGDDCAALRGE